MEVVSNLLGKYLNKQKVPPHEQAAKVDLIVEIVGLNKTYNYTYWLRKVKKFSYGDIVNICKEASNLEGKYNKGGFITNKLCKKTK